MASERRCKTCKYLDLGRCRRRAPVATILTVLGAMTELRWPEVVSSHDWCGEWERAEGGDGEN